MPEWQPEQQESAEAYVIEDSLIRIPATLIGYEVPPPSHPDSAALSVLATILSVGDSSRLATDFIYSGEALVAVSPEDVVFGPPARAHGVTLTGADRPEVRSVVKVSGSAGGTVSRTFAGFRSRCTMPCS